MFFFTPEVEQQAKAPEATDLFAPKGEESDRLPVPFKLPLANC